MTAVAEHNETRFTGTITVKVFSAENLELLREFTSEKLAHQPSVQLLSVDDNGTVLLSVWDRNLSPHFEENLVEEDFKEVTYFAAFLNGSGLHKIETVSNSAFTQNKIYFNNGIVYKIIVERYLVALF